MTPSVLGAEHLVEILGLPFTDEQLAAITAPHDAAVVIAGAGSGKTAVMSARVVWLVGRGTVSPEAVLGLTFTNKAAAELSQRVRFALERLAAAGFDIADGEPTVSTYHAYAASLLREYGLRAGIEPSARLLADATRFQLAERVVRRADGPFHALRLGVPALTAAVVALDGELSEHLVEPNDVREHDARLLKTMSAVEFEQGKLTARPRRARQAALARGELLDLVEAFRFEKQRCEVIDFGDQMAGAARLAEQFPEVGEAERGRFEAVLLDEYQDTSVAQKRLLLGLFGRGYPVTAVGDPFQAIYGWRGASVRNIMTFAADFSSSAQPAPVYSLSQNNRSAANILELANLVADPLREAHPDVPALRPRLELSTGGDISVGLFATHDDEVSAMSDDIAAQVAAGAAPGHIAVLCRESKSFPMIHEALATRGIPVEVVGLGGLLELPEIVELVALLQVIDDPTANVALLRLLTGSRWRIGPRDLALLGERARQLVAASHSRTSSDSVVNALAEAVAGIDPAEMISLSEAVHNPGEAAFAEAARRRFADLDRELVELRRHRADPLPDLVQRAIELSGLGVEVAVRHASTTDHLATFCGYVGAFADLDGGANLGSFLAFLAASDHYRTSLDRDITSESDSVKVMTIHQAKGLEWPTVYLPQLSQQVFPSAQRRPLWTESPQVLPYSLRGDAPDFPTISDWSGNQGCVAFRDEMKERDRIEERRLAYVAFTRAKSRLVISGHWWGPTQRGVRGPSEYLERAHEFCLTGGGRVTHWEPTPGDDETNPCLAKSAPVSWPVSFDAEAAAERQFGASLVRAAIAGADIAALARDPIAKVESRVRVWDEDLAVLIAEACELRCPQRDVVVPPSLSATGVVRLANDPEGLARDLARPMPRQPAPAASRGTRFHAWLESRFGQTPLIDLDELPDAGDGEASADLAALQAAFLSGPFAERTPVAVEAPFQLVLGGRSVRGRIDAVYAVSGVSLGNPVQYEVIDWKTGWSNADPLQLALYRLAWAELHGLPIESVSAAFYYVATGKVERPQALPDRAALTALMLGQGA